MGSSGDIERNVLLLCDDWNSDEDGITGVNRSLALNLTRFSGVNVYSTVLKNENALNTSAKSDAKNNKVNLLYASSAEESTTLYQKFNEEPESVFSKIKTQIPSPTHIIGHSPISASAALNLRDSAFPNSQVILFYHMIPGDLGWLQNDLPYSIPTDWDLVNMAQQADMVFSVTEKLHWYFTAKFRNRAEEEIGHKLFLPQCGKEIFNIPEKNPKSNSKQTKVLALISKDGTSVWEGVDIAVVTMKKVAEAWKKESKDPPPILILGGLAKGHLTEIRDYVAPYTDENVKIEFRTHETSDDLMKDLKEADVCIVTSRSEPFGYTGLQALSAGVPTLISEESMIATMVRRLTAEPDYFLVPITPSSASVRQDASLWRDRLMAMLIDRNEALERTQQLRAALRREDAIKETHDNFVSHCLGGIRLRHEAVSVDLEDEEDPDRELEKQRSFNSFLMHVLQQCWRLKHHPLAQKDDFSQPASSEERFDNLQKSVTNKIEDRDRRILGIDKESNSFLVYCPTTDALVDLWAMCDVINNALCQNLLGKDKKNLLKYFGLQNVEVRTVMAGSEFLKYKQLILQRS